MITIQSAMLVALGFLAASLLALMVAPAFWARAVRLTSRRIRNAMPLSEAEIRADKDRLRAEHAIRVHQLESAVEQAKLASARQLIDLNRRDASINELESEIDRGRAALEEAQNARRVLEQTMTDRLPRVEQRLSEARRLIFSRDREIADLTRTADKQSRALAEAAAINAQQLAEIERLTATLATRAQRRKQGPSDPRYDSEVALRSELEALRAKTRDQSQLISRMQSQMGRFAGFVPTPASTLRALEIAGDVLAAPNGADAGGDKEAARDGQETRPEVESELRALTAKTQDQSGEIARLKAALAVFEGETEEQKLSIRDSRIALKARIGGLEAQIEQQKETIQRVRSELAAANERLARQAAHFTSELKRLGAGTVPTSGQARRQTPAPRLTLADRVAQVRMESRPDGPQAPSDAPNDVAISAGGPNGATVESDKVSAKSADDGVVDVGRTRAQVVDGGADREAAAPSQTGEPKAKDVDAGKEMTAPVAEGRKSRLLERISGLAKTS